MAKVLAWDRRGSIRPLPLQGREANALLAGVPPDERLASWHLVEPDGTVASGGDAFPPLLRRLPGGGLPARLTAAAPGLTRRAYRLLAGNRDRLGPLIPDGSKARADRRLAARRDG